MRANSSTSAASRVAARPSVPGHCENALPASVMPKAFGAPKWLRGFVTNTAGMPSREPSAICCTAFSHAAIVLGGRFSRLMNWRMCRPTSASVVAGEVSRIGPGLNGFCP
jgi:hypothetical protein